jgi:acyl-coenzyme A thioesterase PaaI-like protein
MILPAGFESLCCDSPFVERAGNFVALRGEDGIEAVGAFIDHDQSNSRGYAHGGFLLSFAGLALSVTTRFEIASMTAEFLRPARIGSWIEARVNVRKSSSALIFADAIVTSENVEVMLVTGLLRPRIAKAASLTT